MMFSKPLFSDTAPNITPHYMVRALSYMLLPWKWVSLRTGTCNTRVENQLAEILDVDTAFLFDSGRSALYYALKAVGIGKGDEVIVPGYTCIVVSNAITQLGAKPVYVDITHTLNIDTDAVEAKITPRTKALLIQHTFGKAADIDGLLSIAKKHNLKTIEDAAHALGGRLDGTMLGTFGDIGMFSFGSDKIASCIRGGALVTSDPKLGERIAQFQRRLPKPGRIVTLQHLMYYPVFQLAKPLYNLGIGKVLLRIARSLHLIARIIYPPEQQGKQVLFFPSLLANSQAHILYEELKELDANCTHRSKIHALYAAHLPEVRYQTVSEEEVPLYFAFFVKDPIDIQWALRKKGIHLSLYWTGHPIVPARISPKVAQYREGQCPVAEDLTATVVTLPTHRHISEKDAERIAREVQLCIV